MEKLKKLKWVLIFFIIFLIGGFLTATVDWTGGMFTSTPKFLIGMVIIVGFIGTVWSAVKLLKK